MAPMTDTTAREIMQHTDNIPALLQSTPRWAPWRLRDNPKGGKPLKVPDTSVAEPRKWRPFDEARERAIRTGATGLGFVMTEGVDLGITAIDIDGCIDEQGVLSEFAADIVRRAATYTEVSPSGRGLRLFALATAPRDFLRLDIGLEVYSGHRPRYVTVTGQYLAGTPRVVCPAQPVVDELVRLYAGSSATAKYRPLPEVPTALPELDGLGLPHADGLFLTTGEGRSGDGSRNLFAASCALCKVVADDAVVLGLLLESEHAVGVAERHWPRHDPREQIEAATQYLWVHHVCKARAEVGEVPDVESLFDDLVPTAPAQDFADLLGDEPAPEPPKAEPTLRATEYVVDGLLSTGLTYIAGGHGVGKSSLLVSLCSLVTGEVVAPPGGPTVSLHRKVLYITEDTRQAESIRYGLARHHGMKVRAGWFVTRQARRLHPEQAAKLIREANRRMAVRHPSGYVLLPLIVFDTTNACFEIESENDSAEVGRVMDAIKRAMEAGCVWLVGHLAKALLKAELDALTGRGSGAWEADAQTTAFIVSHDINASVRVLATRKRRFETEITEVAYHTVTSESSVPTPWGATQLVCYRHGDFAHSTPAARAESKAQARAAQQDIRKAAQEEESRLRTLHDRDMLAVAVAEAMEAAGTDYAWMRAGLGGTSAPPDGGGVVLQVGLLLAAAGINGIASHPRPAAALSALRADLGLKVSGWSRVGLKDVQGLLEDSGLGKKRKGGA